MILFEIIFFPIVCGIICPFMEMINTKFPKWISIICIGITLLFCLLFWYNEKISCPIFNNFLISNKSFVFTWIYDLNILFSLSIDKLSLLMITITSILGFVSVLCSWNECKKYHGLFYLNLLILFSSTIGVFLSSDLFLFLFFWELTLIPTYFLVSIWGNEKYKLKNRFFFSNKFFIYSQASGMILLISIISLVLVHYNSTNELTFSYQNVFHNNNLSKETAYFLMTGFFLAFAIKMPMIPFHGWMINFQQISPTSGSVELISILLKTSIYGIIKFCLPIFSKPFNQFFDIIQYFGLFGIFYGSFVAISQKNIKKFISYINIIHMGFILITICNKNSISNYGLIIQIFSYILSISGLVIVCGQLHKRLKTYEISYMYGIWNRIQLLPAILLFFLLSMTGIPGTGNFSGEIIALFGIFLKNKIVATLSLIGIVVSSICFINLIKKMYYCNLQLNKLYPVMTGLEKSTVFPIILLLLIVGIFPKVIFI